MTRPGGCEVPFQHFLEENVNHSCASVRVFHVAGGLRSPLLGPSASSDDPQMIQKTPWVDFLS